MEPVNTACIAAGAVPPLAPPRWANDEVSANAGERSRAQPQYFWRTKYGRLLAPLAGGSPGCGMAVLQQSADVMEVGSLARAASDPRSPEP
jgi:hypothetical protein